MCRGYHLTHGLLGALVLLLGGCGGADFGGEIRVPANQRHVLAADTPAHDQVLLPGDHTFNIHLKTSSQNPGTDGTARGDSDATPEGQAFCLAEAADGGTAQAEFKLGHRIEHESKNRQAVAIQVEFELEQSVEASRQPASDTLATGDLFLAVLDARKRPIANVPINQTTSDDAVGTSLTTCRFNLPVLFEPDQSYNIILFGKVQATAAYTQQAAARLSVHGLKMRLTFTPAPAETQPSGQ